MAEFSTPLDDTYRKNGEAGTWRSKCYDLFGSETDTDVEDGGSLVSESGLPREGPNNGGGQVRESRRSEPASKSLPLACPRGKAAARGRALSNSKSTPDFQAEDFKESSGVSSMSSSPRSAVSSRSCSTLSDCLLGGTSESFESDNYMELLSSAPNFVASSPVTDRTAPAQDLKVIRRVPVAKCPYSIRRDFCREDCRYSHEAPVGVPLETASQNYGISNKVKLDFTISTLQQREHLRDWPKSPYLRTHAMYQFMMATTLFATSSKRLEGPCTSNGLLDIDVIHPCTVYRPCLIDSLILAESNKARGQSGGYRTKNRASIPWS